MVYAYLFCLPVQANCIKIMHIQAADLLPVAVTQKMVQAYDEREN